MSKSVDERVVQMQFENKQFESNAKTTMKTLENLKKSLNFSGASKSFEEVNKASKNLNFSALLSSVEAISGRFSTLGIIGVTALQNITNQALSTAQSLLNSLTLAPITAGFHEYETQIGAIQTILANTSMQGTTLEQVTAALDELNLYADKTIYNFTEMTRNIGTFTAAGVDLKTSVEAIKGIANLAAMSGSTSQQASTAMYQLSQALAAGRVSLQDWNSVVNAGMGGKVFQEALMQTAEAMGIAVDRSISFRESISAAGGKDSWLTSEVLLNTLRQFTGDMTDAELAAMGFTDAQIKSIQAQAKTANEAATQVKTLTQLFDTMGESVTSGWTETWEIIVGDFEEARELFTGVSDVFGEFVGKMSDARNDLLRGGLMSGWKQFLNEGISNQDDFIESIRKISKEYGVTEETIDGLIEKHGTFEDSLKEGWMTADILKSSVSDYASRLSSMSEKELEAAGYTSQHVEELNKLNEGLQNGTINVDEFLTKMARDSGRENIIEGLSQAFRVLLEVIKPIGEAFNNVFESLKPEQLYEATVSFREFFTNLSFGEENAKNLRNTFEGLFSIFDLAGKVISSIGRTISALAPDIADLSGRFLSLTGEVGSWLTSINNSVETANFFGTTTDILIATLEGVFSVIRKVGDGFSTLSSIITTIGNVISTVFKETFGVVKNVFSWITNNLTFGDLLAALSVGSFVSLTTSINDLVDQIKSALDFSDVLDSMKGDTSSFSTILNDLHNALTAFTEGIRVASLIGIATAVALLTSSIKKLSEIRPEVVVGTLIAIKVQMSFLNGAFKNLVKTLKDFKTKGVISASITMIAMAKAIEILSGAMVELGQLDFNKIISGLVGVGGLLLELTAAIKFLGSGTKISLKTSASMIALAYACTLLSDALVPLSSLSWEEIAKGLVAMGGALAELSLSMKFLNKFGGFGSILGSTGILIATQSLSALSDGLQKLGSMDWIAIKNGLFAMSAALTVLTLSLGILSKVGGFGALLGGGAILVATQSLEDIAFVVQKLGSMDWTIITKGLTAMSAALTVLTLSLGILSAVGGFGSLLGGGAILIASQSLSTISENLKKLGSLSWEEIQRGLVAMGGALTELGVVSGVLGKLSGMSGLLGAATILVATQGLSQIANALSSLGSMSWEEIAKGLVAMGGALAELGVVSGVLGYLTGLAGLVGAGTILLAVQGLDDLANAFAKFGSMSWEEIKKGITAMGSALMQVAGGSFANTLSFLGAMSIEKAVKPIGDLADSIKKWKDVSVPDTLGTQLSNLAQGINSFTFSGFGAGALAKFAIPIGDLADSIKKWSDVSVPEGLKLQLMGLAQGISSLTLTGFGADALATFAIPIGDLADSMKKWSGVSVPSELGSQLSSLAGGINAFIFGGFGADAMAKAAPGLGSMADAVSKWNDVTIPSGLGDELTSLANGVKAFTFAFVGGMTLDGIRQPLINFAEAVLKWKDVRVPETLEDDLKALANGVNAFSFAFAGGWSISQIITPLADLSESVKKWVGIDITGVGPQIASFASGLKFFNDVSIPEDFITQLGNLFSLFSSDSFSAFLTNVGSFSTAMSQLSSIDTTAITTIKDAFSSLAETSVQTIISNFISEIANASPQLQSIGTQICSSISSAITMKLPMFVTYGSMVMTSFNNGMTQSIPIARTTMDSVLIGIFGKITEKLPTFMTHGMNSATNYTTGISSKAGDAKTAAFALVNSALEGLTNTYEAFYSAGENAGAGFVDGLSKYAIKAAEVAGNMANAAVNATNKALDAHSPSKKMEKSGVWGGEGFVNGLKSMIHTVATTSFDLGETSVSYMKDAISRARAIMNDTTDLQPTITPVVDLSDVNAKVKTMNSVFNANRGFSIGVTEAKVAAVARGMTSRQNGVNVSSENPQDKSSVQNFNFTQNNYSPKALSRLDIYRQTKNQFAQAKEAVSKK